MDAKALVATPVELPSGELWEAAPCTTRVAPPFDAATWRLVVSGAVRQPVALDYATLLALPRVDKVGGLRCRHGYTPDDLAWEGVPVRDVLALAEPRPEASQLLVWSGEAVLAIPLTDVVDHPALLAFRLNGQPLTREHGAPCRLVIPHLRARFSVKWVDRLELAAGSQ
jgi:DMSO/TMAO reductase YedYZ molybdopterin-dependent catalytic subunit